MSLQARLDELEARLGLLEDRAEIFQLMASYGPAVDGLAADAAAALWTAEGVYRSDDLVFAGQAGVASLVQTEFHQAVVQAGSAHVVSLPHLIIDGDHAVATNYSQLVVCQGEHHDIARVSANRWEFVRAPQGWRVRLRSNRRLDGNAEARQMLRRIFPATGMASEPGGEAGE